MAIAARRNDSAARRRDGGGVSARGSERSMRSASWPTDRILDGNWIADASVTQWNVLSLNTST